MCAVCSLAAGATPIPFGLMIRWVRSIYRILSSIYRILSDRGPPLVLRERIVCASMYGCSYVVLLRSVNSYTPPPHEPFFVCAHVRVCMLSARRLQEIDRVLGPCFSDYWRDKGGVDAGPG